jgi:hypothetical protein
MQHTQSTPSFGSPEPDFNPGFNVVIAYEDFETGKHAKKTYDFLVENLGHDCPFSNQMWKFDVLNIPKLREMAVRDATQADIVLISSHGRGDLPDAVKSWIDCWLAEPRNAIALVALFACPREETARTRVIRAYLASVAKQGKIEFFAQPDDWPGRRQPDGFLPLPSRAELNGRILSTLAGAVQKDLSFPRWGIDE